MYYVLSFALFIWIAATAWSHLPYNKLNGPLLVILIPRWTFFAPIPGTIDYYLFYREDLPVTGVTRWKLVELPYRRKWYNVVWNPERRQRKALFDLVSSLFLDVQILGNSHVLGVPFLILTHVVEAELAPRGPRNFGFAIMGRDQNKLEKRLESFYVSRWLHSCK